MFANPSFTIDFFCFLGLRPYTEYEYTVTACTAGGCTTTNPVSARTDEAPPQGKGFSHEFNITKILN